MTAPHKPQSLRWLFLVGGAAAVLLFGAFLTGAASLLRSTRGASDNWLIILFNLNFRPASTQPAALSVVSLLDTGLMFLFGIVMGAMYPALKSSSRTWAAIAAALPFLGIPHALYNPLKVQLRILALAIPGGMELFFDELESAILDGSLDDAKHREISRKYGIEWLEQQQPIHKPF